MKRTKRSNFARNLKPNGSPNSRVELGAVLNNEPEGGNFVDIVESVLETFVDDVEEGTVDEVVEVLSINFRFANPKQSLSRGIQYSVEA
jgi:hypothetical protein